MALHIVGMVAAILQVKDMDLRASYDGVVM